MLLKETDRQDADVLVAFTYEIQHCIFLYFNVHFAKQIKNTEPLSSCLMLETDIFLSRKKDSGKQ